MRKRTPRQAERQLLWLKRALLPLGLAYVGLHLWVSWGALQEAGALASLATLLTLGFGDLYWAWSWWGHEALGALRHGAVVAAVLAFTSWLSRPFTSRYLLKLGLDTLELPGSDTYGSLEERESNKAVAGGITDGERGGSGAAAPSGMDRGGGAR